MGLASDEGVSSGICQTESKAAADQTPAFSVVAVEGAGLTVADRPISLKVRQAKPGGVGSHVKENTTENF
jgi:hypothetical protein